jgi:hypothetical protein
MKCLGGHQCAERMHPDHALHSEESFYPDYDARYDLIECSTYWRIHNWETPVESNNPAAQEEFGLCNFFCNHPSHDLMSDGTKVWCNDKLFHSHSDDYRDHKFPCTHKATYNYDICFVIDCTGSMTEVFPSVRDTITKVINDWRSTSVDIRTAIVGYTEHAPHNGIFPASNPVSIFPPSKKLKEADPEQAIAFVNSLTTSGGSRYGEAMIDGLDEGSNLTYRTRSSKILFVLADDTPHGDEFIAGTGYPKGCPCGKNWRKILSRMKSNEFTFKFVKLADCLEKTIQLFNSVYDDNMEVIALTSIGNLAMDMAVSISRVIESNLEYSRHS